MNLKQAVTRLCVISTVAAGAGWFAAEHRPLHYAPGVLVSREPEQLDFKSPQPVIEKDGWKLKPLAVYSIEGRLLGRESYRDDAVAALAPWDLALGWGPMSDESVLERLDISQGGRFYHWSYWGDAPVPEKEITSHSSNNHIIPADDAVKRKIAALHVGALVKISGLLVEATHPQASRPWRSSLTRDDTGEGACEIIYVRSVSEIGRR